MRYLDLAGAGNRFFVVEDWDAQLELSARARDLSAEFDGLVGLHAPARKPNAFRMSIHNRDGSEARMCGNGLRCATFASHAWERTGPGTFRVETAAGDLAVRSQDNAIACEVGIPEAQAERIPTTLASAPRLSLGIVDDELLTEPGWIFAVGGPHVVLFVEDLELFHWQAIGLELQSHRAFPDRVNLHAAERVGANAYRVRSFERGVGPTRACGTGAAAVCVAGSGWKPTAARVESPGGVLEVEWRGTGHAVWVGGSVEVPDTITK